MYCVLKYLIELLIMTILFINCDLPGVKKYILVTAVAMLLLFLKRKERWDAKKIVSISLPVVTYLIIGTVCSLAKVNLYTNTLKIILFWMIPLLFAFSLYLFYKDDMQHIVDIQLFASCLAYVANYWRVIRWYFFIESTFAFSFGVFFIYYAYKRKWIMCGIAAFFMYMTDKRIAVLAVVATLLVMGLLKLFRNDKRIAYTIWGLAVAAVNGYLWLICSGTLEKMCKAIGIDTSGRIKIYGDVLKWFETPVMVSGQGLGIVEILLDIWNIQSFSNLHNDLLKFYIELGVIGLFIFLISYGIMFFIVERNYGNDKMCFLLSMTIYSIILYATDNVSIYILYLIPIYSIYFAILEEKRHVVI